MILSHRTNIYSGSVFGEQVISSKIMSALLIPIYAFYVSVDELGFYDLSQTLMGVFSPIIILAIWEALLKFILSEEDYDIRLKIITTTTIFSLIMSVGFICVVSLIKYLINFEIKFYSLILLMIVLNTLVYIWQYYARATNNNLLFVNSGIASTVVNFSVVFFLVVVLKLGLLGLLLAYILGQLSIIIIIEYKIQIIKILKIERFDLQILKNMLLFSIPLVFNLISSWFITGFGRLIITVKLGTDANGLYSFASKFSFIITMLGAVTTMALTEEAILAVKNNEFSKSFSKVFQKIFLFFQITSILGIPAIILFYGIIDDTEYTRSLFYAPWMLIYAVATTMSSNIGSIFQAINKTKYQFLTTMSGGITTLIISLAFINQIGVYAVIIAQILGAIVMFISRYMLINKFIEFKLNFPIMTIFLIFFIISTLILINLRPIASVYFGLVVVLILILKNIEYIRKLTIIRK